MNLMYGNIEFDRTRNELFHILEIGTKTINH